MLKKAIDQPGFCTNPKSCLGPNCEGCCHLTLREECVHGSLEQKCEICQRDSELDRFKAELAAAMEEIKALSVAASALTKEAIEQDAKIAKLRALCAVLRSALVGLVGSSDEKELKAMEAALWVLPLPDEERAKSINGIHAILKTVDIDAAGRGEVL